MDNAFSYTIIGIIVGGAISLITSIATTLIKTKQEENLWQSEFSANYAKLMSTDKIAAKLLARQFSVGIIVVLEDDNRIANKYFIPYKCKISIGRNEDNDIYIEDKYVSRDHAIIYHNKKGAILHDLSPTNQTKVNQKKTTGRHNLNSDDIITIGKTNLVYKSLR